MKIRNIILQIKLVLLAAIVVLSGFSPLLVRSHAEAATDGYPWANAVCVATGKTTGSCPGYDWSYNGSTINPSTGNYYYRNCTDYAAWKLMSLGVPLNLVSGLGNSGKWDNNAPSKGLAVNASPSVGSIAVNDDAAGYGHVAYVEGVSGGQITVSEYNWGNPGGYHTRVGTPAQLQFAHFVHFEDKMSVAQPVAQNDYVPSYLSTTAIYDGRQVMAVVGTDHAIWIKHQVYANSNYWYDWYQLPAYAKSVAAVTQADGRVSVYYVGSDNAVWYRTQTSPDTPYWSAENRIAANVAGPISASLAADGRVVIATVGGDHKVYFIKQTAPNANAWGGWGGFAAYAKNVSIARNADGRLQIFMTGGDNAVWYRSENWPNSLAWSGEGRISSNISGQLSAVTNTNGVMSLFVTGGDHKIYTINQNYASGSNSWDYWRLIPAYAHSVAVSKNADSTIQLSIVGGDGAVWYRKQIAPNQHNWSGETRIQAGVLK